MPAWQRRRQSRELKPTSPSSLIPAQAGQWWRPASLPAKLGPFKQNGLIRSTIRNRLSAVKNSRIKKRV